MRRQPTIREVAAEAGVSVSTVSLALNVPTRVSQATRERVLAAVDTLGFVPKADAVARARRGVGRVGVIAPFTSYPTVARRLNGVLRAVGARPVEIVLFDQESAARSVSPLLGSLPVTGRLDGLIVISLPLEAEVADRLVTQRLPTVLVDVRHPGFDSVYTDDHLGGRLAAEHLLARGHRRFGFVGEAQRSGRYVSPSERRLAGFRAALADAGHPLGPGDVRLAAPGSGAAPAVPPATDLLTRADGRPTAVFAADDTLAAGVLRAARELGLSVPGELAVIGFDDGEAAETLALTTVRQPLAESGNAAMERLLHRLDRRKNGLDLAGSAAVREVELGLDLIVRATA
ncbi:LacI family DNA-binding transcriptional regulator [Spongiactinospora sp. TRM90649]|uniref:LacI family DNA-binding transcriptional regulator n=1 Tax=Spongiactinospora sp. TRM90649 TaxID=3031114 RepID=UPI0023F88244|nr:LacI family DNA-binding transcriptional regulator [Spongiactinospora sp. TRM90649]MDF5755047.1 LacI family DNA-binding transcriptional regulator [Spongiactinospora sp. TRM90649]